MRKYLSVNLDYNRAASTGDIDVLEYLIQRGCDVDIPTKLGRSPLSKACWNGRIDAVETLLKAPGINLDRKDVGGRTALHNACWGGNGGRLGKKTAFNPKDSPESAYVRNLILPSYM